jgi:exodeoxyribonuclease VII small subunit
MKKSDIGYKAALEKLQELVRQIEDPDRDPESLPEDVKKAQELIRICRNHLRRFEEELDQLIQDQ